METKRKSENKVLEIDKKISILEQKLISEQDQCSISDLARICETINNLEEQKRRLLRASGSMQPSDDSMTEDQREKAESILRGPDAFIRPVPLLDNKNLDEDFEIELIPRKVKPRVITDRHKEKSKAGTYQKHKNTK